MKAEQIELLAKALDKANDACVAAGLNCMDGGSANLDDVTIRLKGWRKSDIQKVNALSNVKIETERLDSAWWKGHRFVRFNHSGQASQRYAQVQAAYKSLSESCKEIFAEGDCGVCVFYMMD